MEFHNLLALLYQKADKNNCKISFEKAERMNSLLEIGMRFVMTTCADGLVYEGVSIWIQNGSASIGQVSLITVDM